MMQMAEMADAQAAMLEDKDRIAERLTAIAAKTATGPSVLGG